MTDRVTKMPLLLTGRHAETTYVDTQNKHC